MFFRLVELVIALYYGALDEGNQSDAPAAAVGPRESSSGVYHRAGPRDGSHLFSLTSYPRRCVNFSIAFRLAALEQCTTWVQGP